MQTSKYNNIDSTTQTYTTQQDVRDFDTESESDRSRSPLSDQGIPLHFVLLFYS